MSDISLTSGMRANLLSLQSTVKLLDRTQERLSTGKKVNSALDNPTNFFTAQSHTSRANDLLSFKDAISEAIQTVKAADAAINGIKTLIESAKALAEDAKGVLGESAYSQTLTIESITSLANGNTISIGGQEFTAVTTAASQTLGGTAFYIGASAAETSANLATVVNAYTESPDMDAAVSGNIITITSAAGATLGGTDIEIGGALSSVFTESSIGSGTELADKVAQYATTMNQMNDLRSDAFYKGKNLLTASDNMTVRFGNSHTLVVNAFDGTASGLSLNSTAESGWNSEANIQIDIEKLNTALDTLKVKSSALSSNLSIIQMRSDWISSVSNILQTGADNLVNADTNEEGANMLMLQTRQSLSTSALSMSAQSAQSVLQLFQ